MKRLLALFVVMAIASSASVLLADVKTREKTVVRFEGFMGGMMNRAFGGNDGITSTTAVKGNRMARTANDRVEIIDLAEERIFTLDTRRREYTVRTFADIRKEMEEARAQMAKQQQDLSAEDRRSLEEAGKQIDFDVNVRETGQRRSLAGHDTREVVVSVAMRERGRTLEESGGMVATTTLWLAPPVAALDELFAFHLKYFQAVFGTDFTGMNAQAMNSLSVMLPGLGALAARMAEEQRKLTGTAISSTMVFESVRSAEQMKAAAGSQPSGGGGGGIGGALAGRLMRGRGGPPQARSTVMTTTNDFLSIEAVVTDPDVTIPANFRQRN